MVPFLMFLPLIFTAAYAEPPSAMLSAIRATTIAGDGMRKYFRKEGSFYWGTGRRDSTGRAGTRKGWAALLLRVLADLAEVQPDTRLVADNLGVVAWRDRRCLAGTDLALAAVVHHDLHPARDAVAEVRDLARVGACDRLQVGRPLPSRLEHAAHHRMPAQLEYVRVPVTLERSLLVGRIEVLDLHLSHAGSSQVVPVPVRPSHKRGR